MNNNNFKSFFSFSRKERIGIMGLLSLIVLIFIISIGIRNYSESSNRLDEEKLNLAWQQLQKNKTADSLVKETSEQLFYFDPNSLDSLGFIRLGLSSKTTHYLLNWRSKGKHFYQKEDLKSLYSLSEEDYQRIAPFIQIKEATKSDYDYPNEKLAPLPDHLNLNRVDSATLVRLKGIGPFIAHKIIEQRNSLGGFLKQEQLLELYKFPDSTYQYLKEKLTIDPKEVRKIGLNSSSEADLARHPYIGEKMAKNIILLRSGLKKYDKIEQLRQVPLMNEEKYRKIAAYCAID